jgi:putative salt-induced outer membrane protein YdiY
VSSPPRSLRAFGLVSVLLTTLIPGPAQAQAPAGIMERKQVTQGKTDVAKEGFQAASVRDPNAPPEDTTELSIAGGALLAGGNSRSAAGTGVLRFLVRRAESQISAAAAVNYAQSAVRGEQMETTVENYQANVRYDYFLSPSVSVFSTMTTRRDRFQGLDLRLNIGPGLALFLLRQQESRLWTEIGYDYQHDLRTREALESAAAEGLLVLPDERRHNGRLFAGYEHRLNDKLRFDTGIEYIRQLLVPTGSVPPRTNWRLNYNSALSTEIIRRLSFAVAVTALYDNNPLPNVSRLDVITSLNLVYSLL